MAVKDDDVDSIVEYDSTLSGASANAWRSPLGQLLLRQPDVNHFGFECV